MRTFQRAALAWLAAVVLIGVAAQVGSAALSFSETSFRVVWGRLEYAFGPEQAMSCPITLEGSFHSMTMAQTRGLELGYVTRGSSGTCTGGRLTILGETLPWRIEYLSQLASPFRFFTNFANLSWRVELGGRTCLARATAEEPARFLWTTDETGAATVSSAQEINLPVTGFGCEGLRLSYEGPGTAFKAGTTTRLTIRQI